MERLCHLIEKAIAGKKWKPISLSQGGTKLSHICFADDLILFAEASVAQIRVIRDVLETFCTASGQKVSLSKSKIYFSKNVSRELGKMISDVSGIASTCDLGKYLGMPVLQKRINKETYGELLEKISSKLSGWRERTLSFAGRLTLTKAVLTAIPVHSMSTIILPKSILTSLDRVSRSFLWGSSVEKKKQHLVAWKRVCLPKKEGVLGIKKAEQMNKSLVAKVGWRLLNDDVSFWARVLRRKYRVGDIHDPKWLIKTSRWSSTWRSISLGLREVVLKGLSWVLGDGRSVKFWTDSWLHGQRLFEPGLGMRPDNPDTLMVHELWHFRRGWDFQRITPYISDQRRLELMAMVLDDMTGAQDRISWRETQNGEFSVRTAYEMLTRDEAPRPNMEKFYTRIWRVRVPERVKVFLWLVGNQVIMTNAERYRRHLCDSEVCQVCKGGLETILHVLRDCPSMSGIWSRIVPRRKQQAFFAKSLFEWLFENLCEQVNVEEGPWSTMFALAVWWGWKWRCGNVFGENRRCRDRVRFVRDLAKEVSAANQQLVTQGGRRSRVEILVGWEKPLIGWLTVNTDGASRGNPGLAAAGGVLRDHEGRWCGGFSLNIGRCSAPMAELWGVYYGLHFAWERKAPQVVLEVDSAIVVEFLRTGISDHHPLSFLVRLCHGFLSKDWIVRIVHVYREANRLADGLANYAFSLAFGLHFFHSVPNVVELIWREDDLGIVCPRQIPER
ncbi:putative RNA-directed DNA polymerase [Arabidopsis thaliana]